MEQLQPRLEARGLVRQDWKEARALYTGLGRDGEWAADLEEDAFWQAGEWWGLYCDRRLILCCALAAADRQVLQIRALCGAQKSLALPDHVRPQSYLLPPAFRPEAAAYAGAFLRFLTQDQQRPALAALPVKTGGGMLDGYFAAGCCLWAVRPLLSLRPHYIFLYVGMQNWPECRIMVKEQETLALSRTLEEGNAGVGILCSTGGARSICLVPKEFFKKE